MAETSNGVVKLGKPRRGAVKFQFEEGDVFELDVVELYDRWWGTNWILRDEKGFLKAKDGDEHSENIRKMVQDHINAAFAKVGKQPPNIDRATADAVIAEVLKKVEELRNFTSPKKEEPSSSPTSSGQAEESKEVFSQ